MSKTTDVLVTQTIMVTVDESKFTDEWMAEFRESFYDFHTIDDHIKHLAQLCARGLNRDFIEGYGPAREMGIVLEAVEHDTEVEIQEPSHDD